MSAQYLNVHVYLLIPPVTDLEPIVTARLVVLECMPPLIVNVNVVSFDSDL